MLLNHLPYREPDQLVSVAESDPGTPNPETVDFTTVYDWRTRSHSFEHMSLYRGADGAIVDHGEPGQGPCTATPTTKPGSEWFK